MKKSLFFLLVSVVALAGHVFGQEAGVLFTFETGGRAWGLGGAGVAAYGGLESARYNPAGLGFVYQRQLMAASVNMQFDMKYTLFQAALPQTAGGTLAVNHMGFTNGGIQCRTETGALCGEEDPTKPSFFDAKERLTWLSYARRLSDYMAVGLNLKQYKHVIVSANTDGVGIDLGLLYIRPLTSGFLQEASFGLLIQDANEMELQWTGTNIATGEGVTARDKVPLNVRLGTQLSFLDQRGVVAIDWDKRTNLHLGAEYWVLDNVAVRLGSNDGHFTAGASLCLGTFPSSYRLDYALEQHPLLGNQSIATLSIRF